MSRIDAKCYPSEIQSGAGEMNCLKPPSPFPTSTSTSLGQTIATELVNEIFDSAVDTAMANLHHRSSISPDLVGDILENLKSPSPDHDETCLLDDKLKRMINEMKFPTIGVGDSSSSTEAKLAEIPAATETKQRNTLERKKRLTNLVKNSKHILTKFVKSDDVLKSSKSEESYEKLVRSINLDIDEQGGSRTAPRSLHFPVECSMEVVDLSEKPTGEGRREIRKKLKLKSRILQFFKVRKSRFGSSGRSSTAQKSPSPREDQQQEEEN